MGKTSIQTSHVAFVGSVPENYDRFLGPVLFEPYARDLASRVAGLHPKKLVELPCDTYIVTRILSERLGSTAMIVATDLNQAMIDCGKQKFEAATNIRWQVVDATALPFSEASFDIAVCQFGWMFFPDKAKAFRESHRVLSNGGSLLFNVWDAIELNDLTNIAHSTIVSYFKTDPPRFYEVPFSFHNVEEVSAMLETAGFVDVRAETIKFKGRSGRTADVAHGLVHGNPSAEEILARRPDKLQDIEAAIAAEISRLFGNADIETSLQAIVFRAKKPS